ncbi:MAG: O-antigen ligase family protein [Deltaproteobacteria bacterium]|nr:O-antigen ligase family protein [Deltaproteobacteria bacterium]
MNISLAIELLKSRLFLPGLIFLGINLTSSYVFYHVNSYKIFLMGIGVSLLVLVFDLIPYKKIQNAMPWMMVGILAMPIVAAFPGYLVYGGAFNYNFKYELVTNLILILWCCYLYRNTKVEEDLTPFLWLLALTVVYTGIWAFFEKFGNPFDSYSQTTDMVKATFGHRNYFSGFLILMIPLLLVMSVPSVNMRKGDKNRPIVLISRNNLYFLTAFILGGFALVFAETRAAIAGCLMGVGVVCVLYVLFFSDKRWRKRFYYIFGAAVLLGLLGILLLYFNQDALKGSRYIELFTLKGWVGRLVPWETAISSIKASPWIGYGLGSSYNLFFSFVSPEARLFHREHSYNHAHSEILEYLQESGLLGGIAFIAFWVLLILMIIRLFRHNGLSDNLKKILIGVCGGFAAYHFHSVFSVAPRMIVMKLPLFTLYALVFISYGFHFVTKVEEHSNYKNKRIAIIFSILTLAVIWSLYIPWISQQYQFVKLQSKPNSLIKVEGFEELARTSSDIYTQDLLTHMQIRYGRTKQLSETIDRINAIFPNYREVNHNKAILAMMQGNLFAAKNLALSAQRKDTFHKPTIYLLIELAIKTSDQDLFNQQLMLLTKSQYFAFILQESKNSNDVETLIKDIDSAFVFTQNGDKNTLVFDSKWLEYIFNTGKSNAINKAWTNEDRSKFWSSIARAFAASPFFQIRIKQEMAERYSFPEINNYVQKYYALRREWEWGGKQLEQEKGSQIARTEPSRRQIVLNQFQEKINAHNQKYSGKMTEVEKFLRDKTDWNYFFKKQRFANDFISQVTNMVFQK